MELLKHCYSLLIFSLIFNLSSASCPPPKNPIATVADGPDSLDKFFKDAEKQECEIDEILIVDIPTNFPSEKFFALLGKTTNLKSITIDNCTIPMADFPTTKIHLPNLATFFLDNNCEKKYSSEELNKALFFDINGTGWKLGDIGQLNVNIDVSCHGEPHLSLNLDLMWLKSVYPFTNELLTNTTGVELVSLDIADCELSVKLIPKDIRLLEMFEVVLKDGSLEDVTKSCPDLLDIAYASKNTSKAAWDKASEEFLTKVGVKDLNNFWIAKNDGKWAPGVVVAKPKKKRGKKGRHHGKEGRHGKKGKGRKGKKGKHGQRSS